MVLLRLPVSTAALLGSAAVMLIVTQHCPYVIVVWWNSWRRGSATDVLAFEWKPWMDGSCLFSLLRSPGQLFVRMKKFSSQSFTVMQSSTPQPLQHHPQHLSPLLSIIEIWIKACFDKLNTSCIYTTTTHVSLLCRQLIFQSIYFTFAITHIAIHWSLR